MINTEWQKRILAGRREHRDMTKAGYRSAEVDWELNRGSKFNDRIVDVKVSRDGKHVWFRTEGPAKPEETKLEYHWAEVGWKDGHFYSERKLGR